MAVLTHDIHRRKKALSASGPAEARPRGVITRLTGQFLRQSCLHM